MTPTTLLFIDVYFAAALGMLVAMFAEGLHQDEDFGPLPWSWLLSLALAWPVVLYELLAGEDRP